MHWTIVTQDSENESFQRLEMENESNPYKYQRLIVRALAGVVWFLHTFEIPVQIWGT